jgi:hypothetical protein
MKLISGWGGGKIDQPLISGDKIVEFGIAGSLKSSFQNPTYLCYHRKLLKTLD